MPSSSSNLCWIDLETTGLNYRKDKILEISTIITDKDLNILDQCTFVIHQKDTVLEKMDEWCVKTHGESGLVKDVRESETTLAEAEAKTLEMLKKYLPPKKGILSGSSVHFDKDFLRKYMKDLFDYLHYHILDVTSIAEVVKRWCPRPAPRKYVKKTAHRSLSDIKDSIDQLQSYKKYFTGDFFKN